MGRFTSFIERMQKDYGGYPLLGSNHRFRYVPPLGERDSLDKPKIQNMGNGMMYTGRGPVNEPAGIVDRDEMVLESDLVNELGGPQEARANIENLREMKDSGVPSFESGTGSGTAGDMIEQPDAPDAFNYNLRTAANIGLPTTPTAKDAGTFARGLTTRPTTTKYDPIEAQGIRSIQDLAAGKSPAIDLAESGQRQELTARQAGRGTALSQELAQTQAGTGEARVSRLMDRALAEGEQGALGGQYAQIRADQAQQASSQLAEIGFRGKQFEEQKFQADRAVNQWAEGMAESSRWNAAQFDLDKSKMVEMANEWGIGLAETSKWNKAAFDQSKAQFEESSRQWGKNYVMAEMQFNWSKRSVAINAMIDAGDYVAAEAAFASMGLPVDMTNLKDAQSRQNFNTGMLDIQANINSGLGSDNATTQESLERTYLAQHPDADIKGKDKDAYDTWAKDTYDSMYWSGNAFYKAAHDIPGDQIDSWIKENFDTLDDFEYGGKTKTEAGYAALSNYFETGGMMFDGENNLVVDPNHPAFGILGIKKTSKTVKDAVATLTFDSTADDPWDTKYDELLEKTTRPSGEEGEIWQALKNARAANVQYNEFGVPESGQGWRTGIFKRDEFEEIGPGEVVKSGEVEYYKTSDKDAAPIKLTANYPDVENVTHLNDATFKLYYGGRWRTVGDNEVVKIGNAVGDGNVTAAIPAGVYRKSGHYFINVKTGAKIKVSGGPGGTNLSPSNNQSTSSTPTVSATVNTGGSADKKEITQSYTRENSTDSRDITGRK